MRLLKILSAIWSHPLNRKRKVSAIFRFLKWQVGSRLVPGSVLVNWINGARFVAANGEAGVTNNIYCGLSDLDEMGFLLHALRPHDVFVDAGSNSGVYSILASKVVGAKTYAFEPFPGTFERLLANIRVNNIDERVLAHNCALGNSAEEITFSTERDCMNRVVLGNDTLKSIRVPVHRMDSIVKESVSMIKIDVEGFEKAVLEGGTNVLSDVTLLSLIVELNGSGEKYGYSDESVIELLAAHGFQPYVYNPFSRNLKPVDKHTTRPNNLIFLRNLEEIENRIRGADPISINGFNL